MDEKEYRKYSADQLVGRKAITLRNLRNQAGETIPEGSIVIIKGKRGGFWIQSEKCPLCECQFEIWKVSPYEITLLPGTPGASPVAEKSPFLIIPEYDLNDPKPHPGDIKPGNYTRGETIKLLRKYMGEPEVIQFIVDMLE